MMKKLTVITLTLMLAVCAIFTLAPAAAFATTATGDDYKIDSANGTTITGPPHLV